MKLRAFALGAAVSAAASGLIPATAMAATAATAARPSHAPSASAKAKAKENLEVVTQLPEDDSWHDSKIYRDGREVPLPSGYSYRDGGIVGADDRFYFGPAGEHEGVVVAPMTCQRGHYSTPVKPGGNFLGTIVSSALKACDGIYNAAYGIIDSIIGSGTDDGGQC